MEKQKRWHLFLILTVIGLTIYNIFPTIFYYCRPLKEPISAVQGQEIAQKISKRLNDLEKDSIDWVKSFCDLLAIKPASVDFSSETKEYLAVRFLKTEDADRFCRYFPAAGASISFAPKRLSLVETDDDDAKIVFIKRAIAAIAEESSFVFAEKGSPLYRKAILDRAASIGEILAGPSETGLLLEAFEKNGYQSISPEWLEVLASHVNALAEIPANSALHRRIASSFAQNHSVDRAKAVSSLIHALENAWMELNKATGEQAAALQKRKENFSLALKTLKANPSLFHHNMPLQKGDEVAKQLDTSGRSFLGDLHPFFSDLSIDWEEGKMALSLHADLATANLPANVKQLLINELAKLTRLTRESFTQETDGFTAPLHQLPDANGLLLLDKKALAAKMSQGLIDWIKSQWHPKHPDLSPEQFLIVDFATYRTLDTEKKALCLVVHAPAAFTASSNQFSQDSIYCFAKGIQRIAQNYEKFPHSEPAMQFQKDMGALQKLLQQRGFTVYLGSKAPILEDLSADLIFEERNSFDALLKATREDFVVRGIQRQPFLETSNLEQRLLAENKIETAIHEDLLKWGDEYRSALVSMDPMVRYTVPKPTKNVFWDNVKLTLRKFFRGDEKKVIRWGLDLSGGKTVQIELRDANNEPVTDEAALKQGMNELYDRVNKMGVSEVSIRQVGHQIALDFPGSQALSGAQLVRASTMYFHVVNEQFSPYHAALAEPVNRFLQEIWNEAEVTGKTDIKSINEIAYRNLYGENPDKPTPRSISARTLFESGLRLAHPDLTSRSQEIDTSLSKIAIYREAERHGSAHPLLIIFNNYVLEGSQVDNIRASYDPSKGNFLSFEVQKSASNRLGQTISPSANLHAWTSLYSESKIAGTPLENFSRGKGWRMAVVLNDSVISCPALHEPIRDSASINGSFSQREVSQLATDLKMGSLTFTPHILSEKNVSPELGKADRSKGIMATCVALLLVIGSMVLYYRFAGLVASVAVFFNILIMWAVLQNLNATLSLAGIAGLILTVGMAVDANVLVFERFKEEFAAKGRLAAAMAEGYKKAFSAILDSNVTTIIAALILLNFDAGPIKAFAVTLIIGIASSMFSALFMTKFYFTSWSEKTKKTSLSMANWIKSSHFNFLRYSKFSFGVAAMICLIGGYLAAQQRSTLLGMDFTGGFSLHLELMPDGEKNYAARTEKALLNSGLSPQDFQVREQSPSHHLRLLLSACLDQPGKVFAGMPLEKDLARPEYPFQKNPRIEWIVSSLASEGLKISSPATLHSNWSTMSGQMSDSMRSQALIGLLIAFVCIFLYITFRFEYKFAAAAILCLLHDVLITLGLMGILHTLGVPLQIDLNTIAALMTIIGYSLNDTIIVFDRIREDMENKNPKHLPSIVNQALNSTLSRTSITSGTTLLVLIALVALGGASIFSFSLVMLIGVVFGTLSSWFIASPLMLYFHKREIKKLEVPEIV